MAISEQIPFNSYTGNGVTTVYQYTFKLFVPSDLLVMVNSETVTSYSITGIGEETGGSVTFPSPPQTGATVLLQRRIPYNRLTDYQPHGDLLADVLDNDFDRIVCQIQQLAEQANRAVKVPVTSTTDPDQLIAQLTADANDARTAATTASTQAGIATTAATTAASDVSGLLSGYVTDATNAKNSAEQSATAAAASAAVFNDGDRGDITVSNNGTTWTIDDTAVTLNKLVRTGTAGQVLTSRGSSTAPTYMAAPLAHKNRLINSNFAVNQRAVSGTIALVAGAYGHDRWKAGASGCTYTVAVTNNVTTVTITAGSLVQIIEGVNLQSGTHALSWTGTSEGKIGAGSFGASGITGTVVGGTNTAVEFNVGTLSLPQFEPGSYATAFEWLPYDIELRRCQRYCYADPNGTGLAGDGYAAGAGSNGVFTYKSFPVIMRSAPTIVLPTMLISACNFNLHTLSPGAVVYQLWPTAAGRFYALATSGNFIANAEL